MCSIETKMLSDLYERHKEKRPSRIHLGRVVNTNPGLKVNRDNIFSCIKVLSIAYVLFTLRLLMLKTEEQKI